MHAKVLDQKGLEQKIRVSSPEAPAAPSVPDNNDSICIIPATVLKAGTTYHVEVRAEVAGKPFERRFSFSTSPRAKR